MKVVIPFDIFNSNWENNEIKYMLRSLEKNLNMNFKVVIYGNTKPDFLTNVDFIMVPRYYPNDGVVRFKTYENFFDTINKLRVMAWDTGLGDEFIYIYDDVILLREIDEKFFDRVVALDYMKNFKKTGRWAQTIYASHKILLKEFGKDFKLFYNYEHHVPVKFNRLQLKVMFATWDFSQLKLPYAPISLYFNFFHEDPDIILANNFGMSVSQEQNVICYDHVDTNKAWLNYSDGSLNRVKEYLQNTFTNKSKFEL